MRNSSFPTLVQPFEDELFGSWIARLIAWNGCIDDGRQLFHLLGMARQFLAWINADPVSKSTEIEALDAKFGLAPGTLQARLTTRPFWDCFSVAGGLGPTTRPQMLRLCPACFAEDASAGQPYFHRVHQLPEVYCCTKHATSLIDACPGCQTPFCPLRKIAFPKLKCSCGADFQTVLKRIRPRKAWMDIARFATCCLNAEAGALSVVATSKFALQRLRDRENASFTASLEKAFARFYRDESARWLFGPATITASSVGQIGKGRFRTPGRLIALLCAQGIDFSSAVVGAIQQPHIKNDNMNFGRVGSQALDAIAKARVLAATFLATRMEGRPSSYFRMCCPSSYWLLRLRDEHWLKIQFAAFGVEDSMPAVPPMRADRLSVATGTASVKAQARARMRVRDSAWLRVHGRPAHWRANSAKDISPFAIGDLKSAKQKNDMLDGLPIRFTFAMAAECMRIPYARFRRIVRESSELSRIVPENLTDYYKRRIQWAIGKCIKEGISLSPTRVCRTARLDPRGLVFATAEQLLEAPTGKLSARVASGAAVRHSR